MAGPSVSVLIVSFNTREKLRRCLEALGVGSEIIVYDNASLDGSAQMVRETFPHVHLILGNENIGFGPANNRAAEHATGKLLLYLNSDAYAEPGAVGTLARCFDEPGIAAAGGRLLNPDGSLQNSTANKLTLWALICEQTGLERFVHAYWTTPRLLAQWQATQAPQPSEQVMGACLMTRASFGERFDERFFLYCEDTDLCARLRKRGSIVYEPSAQFTHDLGSSSAANRWLAVCRYNRGKELYFRIHHGAGAAFACLIIDRIGAAARLALWSLASVLTLLTRPRFREQASLFAKVLFAPLR
jgi:GT2 family glycosyltransferase